MGREGADVKTSYLFYHSVMQDIILCGYKTWMFTVIMVATLEVVHMGFYRGIAHMRPRRCEWESQEYLHLEYILKAVGLQMVMPNIQQHHNKVQSG